MRIVLARNKALKCRPGLPYTKGKQFVVGCVSPWRMFTFLETTKAPSAVGRPRGAFLAELVSPYPMMVNRGAPIQHVKRSGNSVSKYTLGITIHRQPSDTISERRYKDARGTSREAQEESGVQIALRDLGSQRDVI